MTTSTNDIEGGGKGSLAFPEEQAPPVSVGGGSRKKKLWIAAAISLALIGLVVGLSVGLTQRNNGGDTSNQDTTTLASQFTESKSFMDAVCSDEDTTLCKEKCEPVDCCNPFAENTCIQENAKECLEYAKCHVVKELSNKTKAAPFDLTDTCETASDDCRKICEENAKCCYDETENCQAWQFLTCMDYAPCQVLNKKATIAPAPSDLIDTCTSEDDDKKQECEKDCAAASCCWDTSAEGNCLETDLLTCITYAPCGSLLLGNANTLVSRPNEAFQDDCSVASVLTEEGYDKCQKHCDDDEATCCLATDESNCFQKDPIGCLQHLPCGLLALAGGDVPKANTKELKEECDIQTVLNGGSFSDACKKACEPAECCIASQSENCIADGNALACTTYLPCLPVFLLGDKDLGDLLSSGNLPDIFGDFDFSDFLDKITGNDDSEDDDDDKIGSPPDDLKAKCSKDDLSECKEECKKVSCCSSMGDDNCLLQNIVACATWNLQGCFAVSGFQQSP